MGRLLFVENMIIKYLTDLSAYVTCVIVVSIAALICLAGAQDGIHINGIPLLFICMSVAFLMQWIALLPEGIWISCNPISPPAGLYTGNEDR